eukprot:TRINITY_DN2352_c0_g1_i2.p1 TRINITY_DN2352_c0_g1~~TRINITY_DN2352_c0_g1_i2.p1  ORF type:complete len:395 (-),score=88.81 TRINITY_DN2352_c0_g1_i2:163-1347(-)
MGNTATTEADRGKNEEKSAKGEGFLYEAYHGPVLGRVKEGSLLLCRPGLESRITKDILDSLGPVEDFQLVSKNDSDEFTITMQNPTRLDYKPFFYNRKQEYGRKHCYWEALCHAVPYPKAAMPENHLKLTASARYANRKEGLAIDSLAIPATLEICALVDAIREINLPFLQTLMETLIAESAKNPETSITPQLAASVFDGAFRNVAVQVHFNEASLSWEATMHLDHLNSSLHMGVTIHGRRTVAFDLRGGDKKPEGEKEYLEVEMQKGDIYLTSPTAIRHGVHIPKLSEEERSVALQLRTLFSVSDANEWMKKPNAQLLMETVLKVLHDKSTQVRMPTYDEFRERVARRQEFLGEVSGEPQITYVNIFQPSKAASSKPVVEGSAAGKENQSNYD